MAGANSHVEQNRMNWNSTAVKNKAHWQYLNVTQSLKQTAKAWFDNQSSPNPYEAQKVVDEYLAFHYCPAEEYVEYTFVSKEILDFPKHCAELCIKHKTDGVLNRVLDVGCSVGRSSFELAREYNEVVGLDYSQAFIAKCQELKMTGQTSYWITTEGELGETKTAYVDPKIDRTKVQFVVGDACNLPQLGQFGCVFAGNLICRLPEPMKFFERLPDLIVHGGILVITSPYTWLEQYTAKPKWIGGFTKEGREVKGFDSLKQVLGQHFDLVEEKNIPFVIRETIRKHQLTVAHATVWKRKEN